MGITVPVVVVVTLLGEWVELLGKFLLNFGKEIALWHRLTFCECHMPISACLAVSEGFGDIRFAVEVQPIFWRALFVQMVP